MVVRENGVRRLATPVPGFIHSGLDGLCHSKCSRVAMQCARPCQEPGLHDLQVTKMYLQPALHSNMAERHKGRTSSDRHSTSRSS